MPWTYSQSTGNLTRNGTAQATGYSGTGAGRNNAAMQNARNIGPIPQGTYSIGAAHDTQTHGPHVMALTPAQGTNTFTRDGFLIHGDNTRHDASEGCIILDRATRDRISASGDTQLQVVP